MSGPARSALPNLCQRLGDRSTTNRHSAPIPRPGGPHMRRRHTRAAAVVTAAAAGGLAAFSLQPSDQTTATLAARNPAVEVRTQVIRRTIYVTRHQPGARSPVASTDARGSHAGASIKSRASGSHQAGSNIGSRGALATRSSGSHIASGSRAAGSVPITTRTSGSHPGGASSAAGPRPVTTRTSGSHGTGGSSTAAGAPVTTRASGS